MSKLFEQVNQIWGSSNKINTTTKPESAFMTTRFVSMDTQDGLLVSGIVNRMHGLPEWMVLPTLKYATPNIRAPRNKFPKKLTGTKLSDKRKNALQRVCKKFGVGEPHGLQIMDILEAQGFILETK